MFTKTLISTVFSAAVLVIAGPAQAQEVNFMLPMAAHSNVSRMEVHQAAVAANNSGRVDDTEGYAPAADLHFNKTRAQVREETAEAIRLNAISRGDQTSFASAAQLARIEMAGQRTPMMTMAAR